MSKDRFSEQAAVYAQFRPRYPDALLEFVLAQTPGRSVAWDAGAGNGQVAVWLASRFERVFGTDISAKQLAEAETAPNLEYRVEPAEHTSFPDGYFDLISVAQAMHWFDFDAFWTEARRVAKPGAAVAIWGYSLLRINAAVDVLLDHFYTHVVGPYWDAERKHIDDLYRNIPFPLENAGRRDDFSIQLSWTLEDLRGYLNTWSSVRQYLRATGHNPVDTAIEAISAVWPEGEALTVRFPVFLWFGNFKMI